MFRQLFSALKSGEVLDEAFAEFTQMLEAAAWMFQRANDVLTGLVPAADVRESIYQRDQSINNLLRSIRGRIVRHLTINPGHDVAASLALMSVAKDAERIGDYCKNVFEVGQFYDQQFQVRAYQKPLETTRVAVNALFVTVRQAWQASETSLAREALASADEIRDRCDQLIEQLLQDRSSIQTHEAVAYSLLARHYKRVAAHLANIATAVRGNIENLDFRGKRPAAPSSEAR